MKKLISTAMVLMAIPTSAAFSQIVSTHPGQSEIALQNHVSTTDTTTLLKRAGGMGEQWYDNPEITNNTVPATTRKWTYDRPAPAPKSMEQLSGSRLDIGRARRENMETMKFGSVPRK
ncbi:hypothetical protein [Dyadobacter sp. CY323]|uniref:hypothetical protein n=1 Tax=Dyadobacter sp. CY323 TaxID=2907302 RepID=UPI001F3EC543|nr:hypothetical protein [Dyadobacter sp. CY323]MCE6992952.1 hypothetical protein [Dyadobacter sp. CY323]